MPIRRRTFVLSVRGANDPPLLENVKTGERVRLGSLREVPGKITDWLLTGDRPAAPGKEDTR